MTTTLSDKISKGRTRIILRDPFFATILMDMDPLIDADATETCATDGEQVIFNPEWLAETEDRFVAAAMRKMAIHVALSHHLRRGPHRDPARWRAACDQAALHIMQAENLELPPGAVAAFQFAGMTADEIYRHLEDADQDDDQSQGDGQGAGQPQGGAGQPDDQNGPQDGQGDGQGAGQPDKPSDKPGSDGGVGQALDGADMRDPQAVNEKQSQNDQRNVRAAMAEKAQGKESGFAKELVEQIRAAGVDWRDRLQAFIDDRSETRFAWSRPNRRFIGDDVYLPGKAADGIGTLAFVVDTSQSMDSDELAMCAAQIEAARDAIGIANVVVIQIDTKVKAVDEYALGDPLPTDLEFHGRGGTNMAPAFDEAQRHEPAACIVLTDAVFSDLDDDPGFPVMFAITHKGHQGRAPASFPADFVDMPAPEQGVA
jgi:predicted metal-dependent peptidase